MNKFIKQIIDAAITNCVGDQTHPSISTDNMQIPYAFVREYNNLLLNEIIKQAESEKNIYSNDERDYFINYGIDKVIEILKDHNC